MFSLLKVEVPNSHEARIVFEFESTLFISLINSGSGFNLIVPRSPFIQMYVVSHILGLFKFTATAHGKQIGLNNF
jgi:hypothetical protein